MTITDWLTVLLSYCFTDCLTGSYWLTVLLNVWLIDCLTDCLTLTVLLTGWLSCWLVDCLTDYLTVLLTGWLSDWLTVLLTAWLLLSYWLTLLLTDWLSYWLVDCLTDWLTVLLTAWLSYWLADCLFVCSRWILQELIDARVVKQSVLYEDRIASHAQRSTLLVPAQSQLNLLHVLTPYSCKLLCIVTPYLGLMPVSSSETKPQAFLLQFCMNSRVSHACYILHPFYHFIVISQIS